MQTEIVSWRMQGQSVLQYNMLHVFVFPSLCSLWGSQTHHECAMPDVTTSDYFTPKTSCTAFSTSAWYGAGAATTPLFSASVRPRLKSSLFPVVSVT